MCPTIIKKPNMDSRLMTEEVFGPVLPIITFKNITEVVKHINKGGKPLAIYYGGSTCHNKNFAKLRDETSSGNLTANDVMMHSALPDIPFGGVGTSGMGRIGGFEAFKQWSNQKSVIVRCETNFMPFTLICPPYTNKKMIFLRIAMAFKNIRQNYILKLMLKFLGLYVSCRFIFGSWGEGPLRQKIIGGIVYILSTHWTKFGYIPSQLPAWNRSNPDSPISHILNVPSQAIGGLGQ